MLGENQYEIVLSLQANQSNLKALRIHQELRVAVAQLVSVIGLRQTVLKKDATDPPAEA